MPITRLGQKKRRKSRMKNGYNCMHHGYGLTEKIKSETKSNSRIARMATKLSHYMDLMRMTNYSNKIPFRNIQGSRN